MRRILWSTLALVMACGGDGGNGPNPVDAEGNWIITFTSNVGSSCSVSQIAVILLADGTSPHEGTYGSYAIACAGQNPIPETAGNIAAYQVSGNNVSIQFSNVAQNQKFLTGSATAATMSGSFTWNSSNPGASYTISGTYVGAKQ